VQRQPRVVGFMPHWESVQRGNWHTVCKLAGIRLITLSRTSSTARCY
jgi:phosphoribosylformylglycinamidine (FGAM) synthase-like amidotransferase family enzyme